MSQRGVEIDDRETIVVGGTIAAMVLAATYWASRIGLGSETAVVLRSLGLSLFILAAPYWAWRLFRRRDTEVMWNRSQPFLTLATVALTALLPFVLTPLAGGIGIALSIAGAMCAMLVVASWLRNGAFKSRFFFTIGAVIFAAWQTGVVYTSRYKMPLYWEILSTTANIHHDPMYVAAMGNMINTYGVPSTGLDGTPYTPYHYGSQWLFTRWSELLGTDLLSFHSLGYVLICVPLFLVAVMMLATEARRAVSPLPASPGWLRSNGWGWLAFAIGTIGIIPDSALYAMAVWNAHVVVSESYLASLPLLLLVIATSIVVWRAHARGEAVTRRLVFMIAFVPAALAAVGFFKVSLMVLLLALLLWAALRTGVWRSWPAMLGILLAVAASFLTFKAVSLRAHNGGFFPLHFMRYSTADNWHQFFPLIHFAWTWVYLAGRLFEERIADFRSLAESVRSGRLLDAELLLILAILGFLPGEVLYIHGGSAIYFSDVQRWVALPLVMARAGTWIRLWRERRGVVRHAGGSMRLATLLALFVGAPFVVTMLINTIKPPLRLLRLNLATRSLLVSKAGAEDRLAAGERSLLFDAATLERGLEKGDYYRLVASMRSIGRMPPGEKADMALFIPQSYATFWHIFDKDDRCTYAPLVAPSVTGMALIDGMPYYGCAVTDQYNMQAYAPRQRDQTPADASETAVCGKAVGKGFRRVLILAPDSAGTPGQRIVECAATGAAPAA